jgi:hypothetical protein
MSKNQSNYVAYFYPLGDDKNIVQIALLDNDKFQVWGKPKTAYGELAKRSAQHYKTWRSNDAFESVTNLGTFTKVGCQIKELTPRERSKANNMIKKWLGLK